MKYFYFSNANNASHSLRFFERSLCIQKRSFLSTFFFPIFGDEAHERLELPFFVLFCDNDLCLRWAKQEWLRIILQTFSVGFFSLSLSLSQKPVKTEPTA